MWQRHTFTFRVPGWHAQLVQCPFQTDRGPLLVHLQNSPLLLLRDCKPQTRSCSALRKRAALPPSCLRPATPPMGSNVTKTPSHERRYIQLAFEPASMEAIRSPPAATRIWRPEMRRAASHQPNSSLQPPGRICRPRCGGCVSCGATPRG